MRPLNKRKPAGRVEFRDMFMAGGIDLKGMDHFNL